MTDSHRASSYRNAHPRSRSPRLSAAGILQSRRGVSAKPSRPGSSPTAKRIIRAARSIISKSGCFRGTQLPESLILGGAIIINSSNLPNIPNLSILSIDYTIPYALSRKIHSKLSNLFVFRPFIAIITQPKPSGRFLFSDRIRATGGNGTDAYATHFYGIDR